ncbi:MAG: choice-of-anchor D domain-containing protein [Deltaproteobacteria bacterium]|nr:choice-of-anchor D domain-containing protein [Deltaproteobacteria bacterium]
MGRIWILTLFAVACNDEAVDDTAPTTEGPAITVDPETLDFGMLAVGASADQDVDICNDGDEPLAITAIEIGQVSAPFTSSSILDPVVQVGACATVTVTFAPLSAAVWDTRLWVHTNDPVTPRAGVVLTGTGGAPSFEISPTSVDFGTVWIGCTVDQDITLSNTGTSDLTILDYTYETDTKDLVFSGISDENGSADGLVTLGGGESWTGMVVYAPSDGDSHTGTLTVYTTDPDHAEAQAVQVGDGTPGGTMTETFNQVRSRESDVIIAVDRSASMEPEMASVETELTAFVTALIASRTDYHLAAVVEDNGCVRGPYNYLDESFSLSNAVPAFATMLNLTGDAGEYTQQGFRLLDTAIAESEPKGCNEGLVREDSRLHLVGISDGADRSPSTWSAYVEAWEALRAETDQLVVHAVGGDWPDGCSGADSYDGFYEATEATEGAFLSICSAKWGAALAAAVTAEMALQDTFYLTEIPVDGSIAVSVDGKPLKTGWLYTAATNSLRFTVATTPGLGSVIEVTYDIAGGC